MKKWALILALWVTVLPASGQNHIRKAMQRAKEQQAAMARRQVLSEEGSGGRGYMVFSVENGDTTFYDSIDPVWIFGHGKHSEKEWRKYYKTVYRFAKVYPYAEASGRLQEIVDSTIAAENMGRVKKDRYIADVQKQLFKDFEGALHKMTISEGAILLKLIDRETGNAPYSIIKDYKNGIAAAFWQGVAKMFDNDLKAKYDPEGDDRDLEELVQLWKAGKFRDLYWSIFWDEPPVVEVPDYYK